jgi:uncharacterized protein YkwD
VPGARGRGVPRITLPGARPVLSVPAHRPLIASLCVLGAALPATAPATAAPGRRADRSERAVVRFVNRVRAHHGLRALRFSPALARAADHHARDMAARGFFSHAGSDGSTPSQRVRRYGSARRVGESLAWLPAGIGARTVVVMWMRSAPHRAVLLSPGYARIGVARRAGRRGAVLTADLATRR